MNLALWTPLFSALIAIAMATKVLLRSRKRRPHWLFIMFATNVAVWYLATFLEARTGGLGKIVGRLLTGEGAFQSRFVAARGGGELILAPSAPGDVQALALEGGSLLVASGALLAADDALDVSAKTRLKNLFVGESLFMLRVSGTGLVLLAAFGAIHPRELLPGESLKVESGHLIAWSESIDVRVGRVSRSWLGTAFSGEAVVATLTGPGVIYMQTRAPQAFGAYVAGFLPRSE